MWNICTKNIYCIVFLHTEEISKTTQKVLFSKAFLQGSNLKTVSNSRVKAPACLHKDFVVSPAVVGMKQEKDAIATVTQKALSEVEGIHSTFPYLMQVSVFILQKQFGGNWLSLLIRVFKNSLPQQSWILTVEPAGHNHSFQWFYALVLKQENKEVVLFWV